MFGTHLWQRRSRPAFSQSLGDMPTSMVAGQLGEGEAAHHDGGRGGRDPDLDGVLFRIGGRARSRPCRDIDELRGNAASTPHRTPINSPSRGADSGAELLEKGAVPGAVVFAAQRQLLHRFALVVAGFTGLDDRGNSRKLTGQARESGLFPRENRPFLISSRGGTRTRTRVTPLRILSPVRLPFRHSALFFVYLSLSPCRSSSWILALCSAIQVRRSVLPR